MLKKLFVLTCICTLGACTTQPTLDVYLMRIQPMPSTLFEQRAQLDLRIQNLTESPVEATGMDLRLIVNGRQLARGVANSAIAVAPLADTTTSIVVSSSVFETVRQILTLSQRETFSYAMKGKVYMSGLNKSFTRSGELTRADLNSLVQSRPAPAAQTSP